MKDKKWKNHILNVIKYLKPFLCRVESWISLELASDSDIVKKKKKKNVTDTRAEKTETPRETLSVCGCRLGWRRKVLLYVNRGKGLAHFFYFWYICFGMIISRLPECCVKINWQIIKGVWWNLDNFSDFITYYQVTKQIYEETNKNTDCMAKTTSKVMEVNALNAS